MKTEATERSPKAYETPELTVYGTIEQITEGPPGTPTDTAGTGSK